MNPFVKLGALFLALVCLATGQQAQAQAPKITLSVSQNPFPAGEVVTLMITLSNVVADQLPPIKLPAGITQAGQANQSSRYTINNGVQEASMEVAVPITSVQTGKYTIVMDPVNIGGVVINVAPLEITVAEPGQMPADGMDPKSPLLRLQVGKTEFYQGEIIPVTATVYLPRGTQLQRIGLIEVEKEGLAVQRFPQNGEQSSTTLGGVGYGTFTFRSSLSALKPGKLRVGPAEVELSYLLEIVARRGMGFFGGMVGEPRQKKVSAPGVAIHVLPLPDKDKPANFSGAVGTFNFSASSSISEVLVGDPVPIDLNIGGTGNFDAIQPPVLATPKGWKTFPARRYSVDQQDPNTADLMNRRIGFSMVIVPENVNAEPPSFEFSFFDPDRKTYQILRSEALSVAIKPDPNATGTVEAATTTTSGGQTTPASLKPPAPQADITDIVTVLPASPTWATVHPPVFQDGRFLIVNSVLAIAFLCLIGWSAWQKWGGEQMENQQQQYRTALARLNDSALNRAEFYRLAAQCLQRAGKPQDAGQIMERYEALNFASTTSREPLSSQERSEVIALLKKLEPRKLPAQRAAQAMILLITLGFSLASQTSALTPEERYTAAVSALEKKNFTGARQGAEQLAKDKHISREVFQLAGNAAFRENNPGLAAIWYQRAMLFPSPTVELKQNLRHVEEKVHVLMPQRNEALLAYGLKLSRNHWSLVTTLGGWLALFSVSFLLMGLRPPHSIWATFTLVLGIVAVLAGSLGLVARPVYADVKDLVFVTAPEADLHTAATLTSGRVIAAPAGSLLTKVLERDTWAYLEARNGDEVLRGWLPTDQITPFWPYDPAALP
jgi:hypothetical protein